MTQIVFQAAAIACCICTAYRTVLFIVRKSRKTEKAPEWVPASTDRTIDWIEPDNGEDSVSAPPAMECVYFLSVVASGVPVSGYMDKAVEEHLNNCEKICQFNLDCITKPL